MVHDFNLSTHQEKASRSTIEFQASQKYIEKSCLKVKVGWGRKLAQQLKARVFAEDPSSILSTHMEAHNYLKTGCKGLHSLFCPPGPPGTQVVYLQVT